MALAKDIPCDAELLETLRLALDKIPPAELEAFARSTPGFLTGGFRSVKTQLVRSRIMSMLGSGEPVDAKIRAMLRSQIRTSLAVGGSNAAIARELENALAALAALKGADAKLAKESAKLADLEKKISRLEDDNTGLLAERGQLKQKLERIEADLRSAREDAERRVDAILQARLASGFATGARGQCAAVADAAEDSEENVSSPAGRICAAIGRAHERNLSSWRIALEMLATSGAFGGEEIAAMRASLRSAYANTLFKGEPNAFQRDDEDSSPENILRQAIAGRIPAILLIDAHNALFALQSRYRLPGEHRWPTAQAREWLVRDVAAALADSPNIRAYVVFDGPEFSQSLAADNVNVIYSGGEGEHRADGVLVDQARFLSDAGAENMLIATNDGELAGLASRHGALRLAPTSLLKIFA